LTGKFSEEAFFNLERVPLSLTQPITSFWFAFAECLAEFG